MKRGPKVMVALAVLFVALAVGLCAAGIWTSGDESSRIGETAFLAFVCGAGMALAGFAWQDLS